MDWAGWVGSLTGLLGAILLAANASWSRWGWAAFLVSNVAWISFGVQTRTWSLVLMQAGFMATSMTGLYRWFNKEKS